MQEFSVEGSPPNVWGSIFLLPGQNVSIGQCPKIRGDFSKIHIEINKNSKNDWENSRKCKLLQFFLVSDWSNGENKEYDMDAL